MTIQEQEKAMFEIYEQIPFLGPSDLELTQMFEAFLTESPKNYTDADHGVVHNSAVITLLRGYGQ